MHSQVAKARQSDLDNSCGNLKCQLEQLKVTHLWPCMQGCRISSRTARVLNVIELVRQGEYDDSEHQQQTEAAEAKLLVARYEAVIKELRDQLDEAKLDQIQLTEEDRKSSDAVLHARILRLICCMLCHFALK